MQFEKLHACSGCYCSLQVKWRQNFFNDDNVRAVGRSKNLKNLRGFGHWAVTKVILFLTVMLVIAVLQTTLLDFKGLLKYLIEI